MSSQESSQGGVDQLSEGASRAPRQGAAAAIDLGGASADRGVSSDRGASAAGSRQEDVSASASQASHVAELEDWQRMVERAAGVYFETCRQLARLLNKGG